MTPKPPPQGEKNARSSLSLHTPSISFQQEPQAFPATSQVKQRQRKDKGKQRATSPPAPSQGPKTFAQKIALTAREHVQFHDNHICLAYELGFLLPTKRLSFGPLSSAFQVSYPALVHVLLTADASKYVNHVSFLNSWATENNSISFTLNEQHMGYQYKQHSRTFMIGLDENIYSENALQWTLNEMVDDGDEIVCLRVIDPDVKELESNEPDKKDPNKVIKEKYQAEAASFMAKAKAKTPENRAISIVVEFAVGSIHSIFQRLIRLYEPAMLIVGTKGRSLGVVHNLIGNRNSFSKWCLQYSPIPVVVVRPEDMRDKKKIKRANDQSRHSYTQILQDCGVETHEVNAIAKNADVPFEMLPIDKEATAALDIPSEPDRTIDTTDARATDQSKQIGIAAESLATSSGSSAASQDASLKSEGVNSAVMGDDGDVKDDIDGEAPAMTAQQKRQAMEKDEAAAFAAAKIESNSSDSSGDSGPADEQEGESHA